MDNDNSYFKQQIGNYRLINKLSSGSSGTVYLAQHTLLTSRTVAIKVLHAMHLASAEEREDFLQEAKFLDQLRHPYILPVLDVGIVDGFPYLVAEYAANGSLRDRIKQYAPHPLPTHEVITTLSQVGQALQYAHQQQVIHRDLKPENILFNAKNEALLADFGLATTLSTASIKYVGSAGTPRYMAPEQFRGQVSKESDQYSLACIAYELVTGQPPFISKDFYTVSYQHLTEEPTSPRQLNSYLSAAVDYVILKAMAKQRGDRYPDVASFISALLQAISPQSQQSFLTQLSTPPAFHGRDATTLTERGVFTSSDSSSHRITDPGVKESGKDHGERWATDYKTKEQSDQDPLTPLPPLHAFASGATDPAKKTPSTHGLETIYPLTTIASQDSSGTHFNKSSSIQPFDRSAWVNEQEAMGAAARNTPSSGNDVAFPYANNWMGSQSMPATRRKARYKWLLLAVACLVIGASIMAVVFLLVSPAFSSHTPGVTSGTSSQTVGTVPSGTTPRAAASPSSSSATPVGKATPGSTPQATPQQTAQPVASVSPTSQPTTSPTHTSTPTPTPTPATKSETLTVDFANPSGTQTVNSYTGSITVTVSGAGGVAASGWSDAFYEYVDFYGNAINPPQHTSCYVMYIDGTKTDGLVSTPAYNSNHWYQFTMNAPGGTLNFSICDHQYSDNHGSLTVTVTQNNSSSAYSSQGNLTYDLLGPIEDTYRWRIDL